jgi:hypothetical protein
MLHKLVIWLLLAPMLLNGLWMVCSDPSSATAATASGAQSEENCSKICLMKHDVDLGMICFALPGDTRTSTTITILDFGAALLPTEFQLKPVAAEEPFVTELSSVYSDPSLSNQTPPPKA